MRIKDLFAKLNLVYETPWKGFNELNRLMVYPRVRLLFAFSGISWGVGWHFYGVPIIQRHRKSRFMLGARLQLRSLVGSNPLGVNHSVFLSTWQEGSVLEIGDDFGMTGGAICATTQIKIGNRVAVGANTTIIDTDFHPLDFEMRRKFPSSAKNAPVVVEDDVFIGMNCLILKGVTLGRGCVIGAGSVVSRSVRANMIAVGNPAKEIREVG